MRKHIAAKENAIGRGWVVTDKAAHDTELSALIASIVHARDTYHETEIARLQLGNIRSSYSTLARTLSALLAVARHADLAVELLDFPQIENLLATILSVPKASSQNQDRRLSRLVARDVLLDVFNVRCEFNMLRESTSQALAAPRYIINVASYRAICDTLRTIIRDPQCPLATQFLLRYTIYGQLPPELLSHIVHFVTDTKLHECASRQKKEKT